MFQATDLSSAYWSAFLLTGSTEGATSAVVHAIGETNRSTLLQRTIAIALDWRGPAENNFLNVPPALVAVLRLPEMQRHCYVLRFLEGMPSGLCGELLGISAPEVDSIAVSAAVSLGAGASMAETVPAG